MWNSSYKYLFWKVILSLFTGFTLYLPFSKYELWPLAFFVLVALLRFQDAIFWLLTGFFFFFLSLRCASIAAIEFGGVNPFLFYTLFTLFALFLSLYQFYLPIKLWQTLFKRFLWALPFLYVFFELLRSYFPYGGFPWLILGSLSVYMPIIKDSLLYTNLYIHSLFLLLTSLFLLQKRFKALFFLWIVFFVMGLLAIKEKEDKLREAKTVRVALVQTAVPQKDKLNREAFRRHSEDITGLVEKAIKDRPQLVILPESALYFFFSEEEDDYNIRLKDLSIKVPILVGLIDIREGMRPYNSAYLLAEGRAVDYYDKVRLFPIGEYMPQPFGFLKEFFPAIGGIDYVSGDRIRPLEYKGISVATPICFEVAYFDLVKSLSKKANFIAVLTNDGWFKNSDCTHQHYLWGRIRALETGKYVLWVNNSSDTGFIDPYGRPIKRMSYMEKGVVVYEVKAVQ
uniref:Apolipoprotein N-acyltransferase n=1 Tax=Hydrogenobacter sp. TaxID=2152829 RepID=A0A7C2ZN82_9AQUI